VRDGAEAWLPVRPALVYSPGACAARRVSVVLI